jgi:uncharacterized damage-inducible protein DinB
MATSPAVPHSPHGLAVSPAAPNVASALLADQLERSLRGGAWHGPALLQAVDGLDAAGATARPLPGAHTIQELVWHAAFWLDVGRQRIEGAPVAPLAPESDWPRGEGGAEERWRDALERLETAHKRLHALVLALPDERLDDPVPGSDPTVRGLLLGLVQHNAYHAGQIVVLRKGVDGSGR